MLRIALSITRLATKEHFQNLLAATSQRPGSLKSSEVVDAGCDQVTVVQGLKEYFQAVPGQMAILISDLLAQTDQCPKECGLATRCRSELGREAFGTLAIVPDPRRLDDIDRTITPDCTDELLVSKLKLIIERLQYLLRPTGSSRPDTPIIVVRRLRTANEMEFRDYLRLRQRVYTAMGYLEDEVENTRSGLEVNEADLHSIHLGAFCQEGARQYLVGTTRVVTTDETDETLQVVLERMVSSDPIAKKRLDTPYLLGLPVFQSHHALNETISEIYVRNQKCGELSRVIVAPEFRGLGISSRLIEEALRASRVSGVQRLFLECLAIHEGLYERHGFQRIHGVEGRVIDVGRTMITMEQRLDPLAFTTSDQSATEGVRQDVATQ